MYSRYPSFSNLTFRSKDFSWHLRLSNALLSYVPSTKWGLHGWRRVPIQKADRHPVCLPCSEIVYMGQQRDPRACLYRTLNDPSLTSLISNPWVMASERSKKPDTRVSPCAESTDDEDEYVKIPNPSGEPRSSEIESPMVSNPLEGVHTLDSANVCDGGVCSATSLCSKAILQQSEGQPDPYAPPLAKGPETPSTQSAEAILQGENAEAIASAKREELSERPGRLCTTATVSILLPFSTSARNTNTFCPTGIPDRRRTMARNSRLDRPRRSWSRR